MANYGLTMGLGRGFSNASEILSHIQAMQEQRKQNEYNRRLMEAKQRLEEGYFQAAQNKLRQTMPEFGAGELPGQYDNVKAGPTINRRPAYAGYGVMEMLQPQGAGNQAPVDPLNEFKLEEQGLKNQKLRAEIEKLMAKGDSSPKWTPSPSLPTTTLNTILRESGGLTGQDPNEMYQMAMKMINPNSPQWDGVKRTSAPQGNPFAKQGQSTAQTFNNWDEYVAWRRGPGANDPDGPALDEYFKQRFGVK